MVKYSEKMKQSMAAKILIPGGRSALSLAGETGISQSTLSKWAREYKKKGGVFVGELQRRPKDWSRSERLQALIDCGQFSGTELGEYLRKKGLTVPTFISEVLYQKDIGSISSEKESAADL